MKAEITYAINKDGIIYNTKSQIFGNCWHDIKIREIEGNGAYLCLVAETVNWYVLFSASYSVGKNKKVAVK